MIRVWLLGVGLLGIGLLGIGLLGIGLLGVGLLRVGLLRIGLQGICWLMASCVSRIVLRRISSIISSPIIRLSVIPRECIRNP